MNFYRGLRNTALTLATLLTVGCESEKFSGEVLNKTGFFKDGRYNLALTVGDSLSRIVIYYKNKEISEFIDHLSFYKGIIVVEMKYCEPINPGRLGEIIGNPDSIHSFGENNPGIKTMDDFLSQDADFFIDESEE